jgi:hypothetical protein
MMIHFIRPCQNVLCFEPTIFPLLYLVACAQISLIFEIASYPPARQLVNPKARNLDGGISTTIWTSDH